MLLEQSFHVVRKFTAASSQVIVWENFSVSTAWWVWKVWWSVWATTLNTAQPRNVQRALLSDLESSMDDIRLEPLLMFFHILLPRSQTFWSFFFFFLNWAWAIVLHSLWESFRFFYLAIGCFFTHFQSSHTMQPFSKPLQLIHPLFTDASSGIISVEGRLSRSHSPGRTTGRKEGQEIYSSECLQSSM